MSDDYEGGSGDFGGAFDDVIDNRDDDSGGSSGSGQGGETDG